MSDKNRNQAQDGHSQNGTVSSDPSVGQTNVSTLTNTATKNDDANVSQDFTYPAVGNDIVSQATGGASGITSSRTPHQQNDLSSTKATPSPLQKQPNEKVDIQSPASVAPVTEMEKESVSESGDGGITNASLPSADPSLSRNPTESLSNLAQKLSTWKGDVSNQPQDPDVSPLDSDKNSVQPIASDPTTVEKNSTVGTQSSVSPASGTHFPEVGGNAAVYHNSSQGDGMFDPPAPLQTDKVPWFTGEVSAEEASTLVKPSVKDDVATYTDDVLPQEGSADPSVAVPSARDQEVVTIEGSNTRGGYPYTIDDLMQIVVERNASDLHITANYPAMIRVDGVLLPVGQELVTEEVVKDLILPTLPESKQELLEVNREVDLAYTFREDARFRINAFYTKGHISGAYRLIPNRIRTIEDLKLPGAYHSLTRLPQGLVLVTGPTGHGKSTTLAAMIQEINDSYPKHIITIEDPVEYVYPRARALVDQREMHEDTHSWEIALRSAMREDPDVVLVGEMRDFETIQSAITLAETGHLVFATLHTNSAAQAIDRMVDVFPEHQQEQVQTQLSMILEAIISQRLIPVKSGGRRAVSEVLLATGAVRNLIREGKSHQIDNVIRTSLDVGMKTLEHSLVDLIREGEITMEEAESVAVHPEEIVRLMKM